MNLGNAYLKLDRASEHIANLSEIIHKERPFSYILETNTQTRKRTTLAKRNDPIINRIIIICGDAIHNLRSALDNAYWEIVSPFVSDKKRQRNVQFPFCENCASLTKTIENRCASLVSTSFVDAIVNLKPYCDYGGNKYLYIVHELSNIDKHRFPTPVGNYTRISSEIIQRQVPDFPSGIINCTFGQSRRDITWDYIKIDKTTIGIIKPPTLCVFEKELDVPVDVFLVIRELGYSEPIISSLHEMRDAINSAISIMVNNR